MQEWDTCSSQLNQTERLPNMTIRTRLSWIFALSALLVIGIMGSAVYIQVARFHSREFAKRLQERVALTELIFLEKNAVIEEAVRTRFLQTLDSELEFVIPCSTEGNDTLLSRFGPELGNRLFSQNTLTFENGNRKGFSKHYVLPEGEFIVIVTAVDTFGQTSLLYLKKILLACALLSLFIIGLASYLGTNHALRPLKAHIEGVRLIGRGKMDHRLPTAPSDDEIGQLTTAFNHMLDSLQSSFQAQRRFVRNASHEMRTPLTAIRGETELILQKSRTPQEYQKSLNIISAETNRLQQLITQLLDLEKAESLAVLQNPEPFSLDQCLLEATESFPSQRLHLQFATSDEEYFVRGSYDLMRTAVTNLLDNALKYSGENMVSVALNKHIDSISITVEDNGIGIPREDLGKIFQPFFRSANARALSGHGIGLPLTNRIIALHKGQLSFSSTLSQGTRATILLPCC